MGETIKRMTVEGRDIGVFDGLVPLDDIARVTQRLVRSPFTRSEVASNTTGDYRHFVHETSLDTVQSLSMWAGTKRALEVMRPGISFSPYRAYINLALFGDMLFTHYDCGPQHHHLTALWYLCETWDVEWGGETIFFDESGDAVCAVTPRPGRLVVFDGMIRHAGRPPNRICYAPRYTFALKLAPDSEA